MVGDKVLDVIMRGSEQSGEGDNISIYSLL